MSSIQPIITNQEFRARWVLKGLETDNEQFRISANATVEARISSEDNNTDFTGWNTLTHNANRNDDWDLSTLDLIFPAVDTALVTGSRALVSVRIQGAFVDRSGADTADTYDKTWSALYSVEKGLA